MPTPAFYLTRVGRRRVLAASPAQALKPLARGSRVLVLTNLLRPDNSPDPEVLVSSGAPGRGTVSLRVFNSLTIGAPRVTRTRNPANITWEAAGSVTLAELQAGKYGAVSDGAGGYIITGHNWRSDVPGSWAFKIAGSVPLLTFVNCNFFGYGLASTSGRGMVYGEYHNAAHFEECIWFSGKPPAGYAGAFPGKVVNMDTPSRVTFARCESYKTGGIWCRGWWAGSGRTDAHPFYAGQMAQYDVDSRMVDASGAWRTGSTAGTDFDPAGFFVVQGGLNIPGPLVEDVIMRNDPVYGAQWEDALSVFASSCTPTKPGILQRFLFEGGRVYDHTFTGAEATYGAPGGTRKFYSGTMGNAGDGLEPSGVTRTADSIPNSWIIQDGTVLGGTNAGLAISTGNRNTLRRNKIISAGAFRSANPRGYTTYGGPSYAMIFWDQGSNYAGGTPYTNGDPAYWFGHVDQDNVVGWWNIDPNTGAFSTSDSTYGGAMVYIPNQVSRTGVTITNRTVLSTPASVLDALALEDSYRNAQLAVWSAAGTVIGCTTPAP